ncbi:hypothetical protein F2Q69_00006832 [Brassica cretica]|uniref:Uncharacterized protein n=1 Tax=Brassica cretica TaxID=69181 RepID=A0A8S9P1V9_BRACR|nr:hypothetical protein F2Q69_00006832 [Brassica cretica]
MLPAACGLTHGRTHVFLHVSDTCSRTPTRPDGLLNGWSSCVATHGSPACRSACFGCRYTTPRASTCQAACAASMHGDTSRFCRHSASYMVATTS